MLVELKCPNCGAILKVDESEKIFFCSFCGTKLLNINQDININVKHTVDRSNDPNLYISYSSINPKVNLITRIEEHSEKTHYINGQTSSFHLPKGAHNVHFKIGNKNYLRRIYIPDDNSPVRVMVTFDGKRHISIDQPNFDDNGFYDDTPKKSNALSVWSFILSFTGVFSIIAIPMAFLDLARKKNDKNSKKGLSIAAIIIGTFTLIVFIKGLITGEITFNL